MGTVLPALALVLVLAALAGVGAWLVRPTVLPSSPASGFVPLDGRQPMASWELTEPGVEPVRSPAMVDHVRTSGANAFGNGSRAMWTFTELPGELDATHWWREAVVGDDVDAPRRYRIRSVGSDGIRLHAQQWGRRGITFGPAVPELPAGVTAGQRWQGEGRAVADPTTTQLYYRSSGRAEAAAGAAGDCLDVHTEIALAVSPEQTATSEDVWRETGRWCPGAGMVRGEGSWRGASWVLDEAGGQPVGVPGPQALQRTGPDPADAGRWQLRGLAAITSDATFGDVDDELISPVPSVLTEGAVLTGVDQGTGSLTGSIATSTDLLWTDWWVRAGTGQGRGPARAATAQQRVLALGAMGSLVLTTTSGRELVAYLEVGRRVWSVELDEVASGPPVPAGPDRLAVSTVAGTTSLIEARSGAVLWQRTGPEPVTAPLAVGRDGVLVTDTTGGLRLLEAGSGAEVWSQSDTGTVLVAAGGRHLLSATYSTLSRRDPATGAEQWAVGTGTSVEEVMVEHDVAAVRTAAELQLRRADDGALLGRVPGATHVLAVSDRWLVATAEELLLVDDAGLTQQRWPLPTASPGSPDPAVEVRSLQTGAGLLWVVGRTDSAVTLHRLGPG